MKCVNCGKEGPHFVPPSLGEPGFYACEKMGNYYLALRFKDEPDRHVTLVYYGGMQDEEVGNLAAYITDVLSVSDADSFDMKFTRSQELTPDLRLDSDKHALPEWVQDLAMMSDSYDSWLPFIFVEDDSTTFMKLRVSHIAIMADGNEFFNWNFGV